MCRLAPAGSARRAYDGGHFFSGDPKLAARAIYLILRRALRELPPDVTGCEDVLPAQVAVSVRELVARHGLPPLRTRP